MNFQLNFTEENRDACYIFELISKAVRKVIPYEEDDVVLVGARDLISMNEMPIEPVAQQHNWRYECIV
jgi:hypothetical protein